MSIRPAFTKALQWRPFYGVVLVVGVLVSLTMGLRASVSDYDIAQTPLYLTETQPPLMMMVMSRDEQLFNKAFSDYTALKEGGPIDTTYNDSFDYQGYFDYNLCYGYASNQFKASGEAGGDHGHTCIGAWSGNFLNWVTMSRLDIMRYVLYGGERYIDDLDKTVLERAPIPNDLHAWVKVYTGSDIANFTPLSGTQSFCNATVSSGGAPLMRYASGNWSEWASTSLNQCGANRTGEGELDTPKTVTDRIVRVEVCSPGSTHQEKFCRKYTDGTTDTYKPTGVLQNYGEAGRLRFGLITGTYANPRDGGTLRRNIGKLAGNSATAECTAGDEIKLSTGQFCYKLPSATAGSEGIINTLSNFRLDKWNYNSNWTDCNNYSILNRQDQGGNGSLNDPGTGSQNCSAWGNPVAEMYAEALRYVGDIGSTRTRTFSDTGDLSGLPTNIAWKDPYRAPSDGGNSYCATCNILVMSSGLPSFDSDDVPSVPHLDSANAATNAVGDLEGITGKNYMAGRVTATPRYASLNTHEDICKSWTVGGLSLVRGICPDVPSTEGSYLIAGLARAAATTDLRPGLQGKDDAKDKITATTYTVAMAENLPKFDINVAGGKITLAPLCQANNSGSATAASTGWRSCFLGSVGVGAKTATISPKYIYGRPLKADGSAGSFSLVWEDSLWGNDHDNDVVSMMTYCVGAACRETGSTFRDICWATDANSNAVCRNGAINVTPGADEILVRMENLSAYAGNAMLTGFTIVGSDAADNVQRLVLRPGDKNGSVLTTSADFPGTWAKPIVKRFKLSNGQANQLESPLWYAAKYGVPSGKWDTKTPGTPDNYFLARDPSKLKEALEEIFEKAAGSSAPVSGGGSGARISTGSFTLSASYNVPTDSNDWTGDLTATAVTSTGGNGNVLWSAAAKLAGADRNIIAATSPTHVDASNQLVAVTAAPFEANNIPGTTRNQKLALMGLESIPAWFDTDATDGTVEQLISYLKGGAVTGYRTRSSILGDIVNSSPEVISPNDDYGYASWASFTTVPWKQTLGASYKNFLEAKKGNGGAPAMAYVGANDGMLHAFNASTTTAAGTEEFAYVPYGALRHIAELANPSYVHRYYVDGLLTAGDAYYDGGWSTVLVGSTGGGAATRAPSATQQGHGSVFALDVSDPENFDEDNVLWELSGANDNDLGFVMGKPVIVPVASAGGTPRFVALFGNGVNSTRGYPVLFAVDIETGEVLARLSPTSTGDNDYGVRNGLMNIAPIAVDNNDGLVDTVYGGDMLGHIWKFDLSSANPAEWSVAFGGQPLFTAARDGTPQPVTGGIEVTSGPGGGVSVFFGTGQYFATGDNSNSSPVQSLYSVWDDMSSPVSGRDQLVSQVITESDPSSGYLTRAVSSNEVSYVDKRGWYVDLEVGGVGNGERFVGNPNIQNGRVFFTTYTPGEASCTGGGGTNWLYGLNLLSGAGAMSGVTTSIGGDSVCEGDCGGVALGKDGATTDGPPVKDTSIFVPKLTPCDPADDDCSVDKLISAEQCTFVLRAPGADPLYMPRPCGRQSWRQVR